MVVAKVRSVGKAEGGLRWFLRSVVLFTFGLMVTVSAAYAQAQKPLLDLNTASEKELEALKGVGPVTAKKIIAGRPYSSVADLSKAGVPEKTIEGIKPFVTVGKPVAAPGVAPEKKAATPAAVAKTETPPSPAKAAASVPAPAPSPAVAPQKASSKASGAAPAKLAPGQKVNINTASKEQLDALPEIGPVKAQTIIDGRPYKKIEDIMKVKGIKQGTFDKIRDHITVD